MDIFSLLISGFDAIVDYALAHTLFCLVPAFFIAGAMVALLPKEKIVPYLGKKSRAIFAYPIAVTSGLLLAVCSCTVLPLFAGIKKKGAGLGPAITFLYTAPATNILAILYTSSLLGMKFALGRIVLSIIFAVATGYIINKVTPESNENNGVKEGDTKVNIIAGLKNNKKLLYLFGSLIAILLVGTRISEEWLKYGLEAILLILTYYIAKKYYTIGETNAWMSETWSFTKTIFPLLLVGIFFSGIIRSLVPFEFIGKFMGNNGLVALSLPVLFGIFVYFPTLLEVPMAKMFLDLGMSKGALMAYVLADPVVSLPSLLVVRKYIGTKRMLLYAVLIYFFSVTGGFLYGTLVP